jgi:hypothetical protein
VFWIGLAAGICLIAVGRIALLGWSGVAPDDARYLHVGLALLDGHGPISADGTVFLLRSPVYPAILAIGSRLTPGDPIAGAHLAATTVALAGLLGAIAIGWRLGGAPGAAGVAVALAASPLIWSLVPTLRIDLAQATGVVAMLLSIARPAPGRWLLAGVALGLTVLIKESALPLIVLPVAFVGTVPLRRLARLTGAYLAGAVLTAGWWWVVVWREAGAVFPMNALAVIEGRRVGADLAIGASGISLAAIALAGWVGLAIRARHDPGVRPLLLSGLLLAPPALFAALTGLDPRNYAVLAVLSAVAIGVVAGDIARLALRRRAPTSASAAVIGLVSLAVVAVGSTQALVPFSPPPPLPALLSAWLVAHTEPGDRIVMTFRYRALVALELYGRNEVAELRPRRVGRDDDPGRFVWLGIRDRQLFGYERRDWAAMLGLPGTRDLAIVTPHDLAPAELLPILRTHGSVVGLSTVAELNPLGAHAAVFAVAPETVSGDPQSIPLVVQAEAAFAWLELAAGDAPATERLVAARPIVVGAPDVLAALGRRLGDAACLATDSEGAPPGAARLEPGAAGACH